MARKPAAPECILELPVTFGNLSIGETTARLGIRVSRGNLTVSKADKHLCCKRLSCTIIARSNGAQADQESLPGIDAGDEEINAVCDVKGYSVGGKTISLGLTLMLSMVSIEKLSHFPKREGRVLIESAVEIEPEDDDKEE